MSQTRRLLLVLALNLALVGALVTVGVTAHSLAVFAEGGDYLLDAAVYLTWLTITEFRRVHRADLRVPGSGCADLRTKSGRKVGPCLRTCGR